MNVLYLTFTEKISGGETSLLYYLKELKKDVRPIVIIPKEGPLGIRLHEMGIKTYTLPLSLLSKKNPFPFLRSLINIIIIIIRERISIIHANGMAANQLSAIVSFFTRRPLVLHLQNFVEKQYFYKYFFPFADAILVLSSAVLESLRPYVHSTQKIMLLRHAVPLQPLSKKTYFLHKELHLKKKQKLVALIGLLEERKGHEYFIRAANLLKQKKDITFVIIGDSLFTSDDYKKRMHHLVQELQLKNVLFCGYRQDIPKILQEIDILVVPSLNEPLGLIAIEANSFGVPVIGFKSGGLPEIIDNGSTGYLIPEGDTRLLAHRISFLLTHHPVYEKMKINSRLKIKKEFNIEDNARHVLELYYDLRRKA